MSLKGNRSIAFHEAGHVIVGQVLGVYIHRCTIDAAYVEREDVLRGTQGRTWFHPPADPNDSYHRASLAMMTAGVLAQRRAGFRVLGVHRQVDDKVIAELALRVGTDDAGAAEEIEQAKATAGRILGENWGVVERVAAALLSERWLGEGDIRELTGIDNNPWKGVIETDADH